MIRNAIIPFVYLLLFLPSVANTENINIDTLVSEAKKSNKHVLLFFHKDGCSFCEKMIDTTLGDDTIEDIIDEKFIFADIGISQEGSVIHRDFNGSMHGYAKSLEIGFYPTVGFVDGNNRIVYGAIGYRDIKSFTLLLEYIYGRHYDTIDIEEFRNNVEFESED